MSMGNLFSSRNWNKAMVIELPAGLLIISPNVLII
jgi:hypothetical protein